MKKIIIAEDDNFLANAYRFKLTKSGYEIKITGDGVETLAALHAQKPDLLILDLVMPKKDGFMVLGEMKKDPNLAHLPVIVASNLMQKEDIDKAMALGATDYVVKSDLSLNQLIEKIKKAVGE